MLQDNELLSLLQKRQGDARKEAMITAAATGIAGALSGTAGPGIIEGGKKLAMSGLDRAKELEDKELDLLGTLRKEAAKKAGNVKPLTTSNITQILKDGKPTNVRIEDAVGQQPAPKGDFFLDEKMKLEGYKASLKGKEDKKEDDFKRFSAEDRLLNAFRGDKSIKDTLEMASSYKGILSAPDNSVGDMAIIFQVQKILDPGSVTRESEFRTLGNAGRLDERVQTMFDRLMAGERMTKTVRDQYKDMAQRKIKAQRELVAPKIQEYVNTATTRGFKNIGQFTLGDFGTENIQSSYGMKIGTIEDNYRYTGGDPDDKSNWEKLR